MEKRVEILDLEESARRLVAECELTGSRTLFTRGERIVATLISWDEYNALRETIALMNDAALRARMDSSIEEAHRGNVLALEDLTGMRTDAEDRLRFPESLESEWKSYSEDERALLLRALEQISDDPIIGAPLLDPLRGTWSQRLDGFRIVYRVMPEARFVLVMAIGRT